MLEKLIKLADELDMKGELNGASIVDDMLKVHIQAKSDKVDSMSRLLDFSDELDRGGLSAQADKLDEILRKIADDEDDGDSPSNSEWHELDLKKLTDKMNDDGLKSLSIEVNGFTVRVTEIREE
jgi:hypothetical protein